MPLYHDDDQTMLADTARQFMAEEGAIAKQLRHWRDRECKDGFGHALWKQINKTEPAYILREVGPKPVGLNLDRYVFINQPADPRSMSVQQTGNTCYFQTYLFAVLCKAGGGVAAAA